MNPLIRSIYRSYILNKLETRPLEKKRKKKDPCFPSARSVAQLNASIIYPASFEFPLFYCSRPTTGTVLYIYICYLYVQNYLYEIIYIANKTYCVRGLRSDNTYMFNWKLIISQKKNQSWYVTYRVRSRQGNSTYVHAQNWSSRFWQ